MGGYSPFITVDAAHVYVTFNYLLTIAVLDKSSYTRAISITA